MSTLKLLTIAWLCACGACLAANADQPANSLTSPFANPDWSLTDIEGVTHPTWSDPAISSVVLVFISTDCPIANYYHPTLRQLQDEFSDQGVAWYFVHTDPDLTEARAQQHATDFSLQSPILFDPEHKLARAAGATKMPQAAVLTRDASVAYLGRIDNTYAGYGKKRARPTRHDLREALTAVVAGKPVPNPRTESVGCYIPFRTSTR